MSKYKLTTPAIAGLIVIGLIVINEVVNVPNQIPPNFDGYRVIPPTTRLHNSVAPGNTLPRKGGNIELPSELRDYSKYRNRMLDRGRTEEQIARDYARAIRKYLDKHDTGVYQKLRDKGIDPEYDLHEMDESLDELVPEY